MREGKRCRTFRTDYLVLRAHADSPQQPPLLFAENAVNLPHWWEVKLIWWPIKVEEVSLVIIHVAANHFNTKGRFKAGLSGCWSVSNPGLPFSLSYLLYMDFQTDKQIHLNMLQNSLTMLLLVSSGDVCSSSPNCALIFEATFGRH